MRISIVNGNGYRCDICKKELLPKQVVRINAKINADRTGAYKYIDSIGVCEECYNEHFPYLCGKGLLRERVKKELSEEKMS